MIALELVLSATRQSISGTLRTPGEVHRVVSCSPYIPSELYLRAPVQDLKAIGARKGSKGWSLLVRPGSGVSLPAFSLRCEVK